MHLRRTRVLDAAVHHWLTEPALKACRHTRQPRFADGRNPTEIPRARACPSGPGSLSQSGVAFCQGLEESLEPDRVTGTGRRRSPLGLPTGATQARLCYGLCIRQTTPGSRRGPNRLVPLQSGRAKHMTGRSPQGRSRVQLGHHVPCSLPESRLPLHKHSSWQSSHFLMGPVGDKALQVRELRVSRTSMCNAVQLSSQVPAKLQVWVCSQLPQRSDGPHPLTHMPRGSGCPGCAREPDPVLWSQQMGGVSQGAPVLRFFPTPLVLLSGSARFLVCLSRIDFNPREQSHWRTGAKTPTAWPGWPPRLQRFFRYTLSRMSWVRSYIAGWQTNTHKQPPLCPLAKPHTSGVGGAPPECFRISL